jgi:hypothetical protein
MSSYIYIRLTLIFRIRFTISTIRMIMVYESICLLFVWQLMQIQLIAVFNISENLNIINYKYVDKQSKEKTYLFLEETKL